MGFNVMKTGPNGVGVRIRHTGASGTLAQLDFENDFFIVLLTQVPQLRTGPFRERLLKAILAVFAPNDQAAPESPDREGQ
jgi:CubicO group peptidase (beta-lactamase class C family)